MKLPKDPRPEPSPKYAEIAKAARESGMDVADDDFEKIDAMIEGPEETSGEN